MAESKPGVRFTFIHVLYVTGGIFLLTIAGATFFSFQSLLEKDYWVNHTNQVLYTAERGISLLKDAQIGTRGYIITHDSLYLEPYLNSKDSIRNYLNHLSFLTRDNPSQQTQIDSLEKVIRIRLQLFEDIIRLKNDEEHAALELKFAIENGKEAMDQIRSILRSITDEEKRLLAIRTSEFQDSEKRLRVAIYLVIVASLVIDILLFTLLKRKLRQRKNFEKALEEKNHSLSILNEELSATNDELNQTQYKLMNLNSDLENRVQQRTHQLQSANQEIINGMNREKAARKEASEKAEQFRLLLETLPIMAWTAQPGGKHSFHNGTWREYTGATQEELLENGWQNYIHPEDLEQNRQRWEEALQAETPLDLMDRRRSKDGSYRWHLVRVLPTRNAEGQLVLWLGTATDIQQIKEHETLLQTKNEELQRTNWDLDNFVYVASHDLRSPIVNMQGLVNLLRKSLFDQLSEREKTLVELIGKSINQLIRTIHDLAEIARVNKDKDLQLERLNFEHVWHEVEHEMSGLIQEADAEIVTDLRVTDVYFDARHLRSIVYNLLSNALKYRSPERKAHIVVRTQREPGYVLLSVSDNGLGLAREQLHKLFTMFKRFHTHVEGTGIGLYIVKRILENHGGRIEVESQKDKGTVFKAYIKTI
jgi:PAS domain S-box-containing protein